MLPRVRSILPRSFTLFFVSLLSIIGILFILHTSHSASPPRFLHPSSSSVVPASSHSATTTTPSKSSLQSDNATAISDPFAYVFYATSNPYFCSALIAAASLRRLGTTHPIILITSPNIRSLALETAKSQNIILVPLEPPKIPYSEHISYYEDVLLKLLSFSLHHHFPYLKRIIVLDSDQLVLKSLDHLFELPSVDVAAPSAYWTAPVDVEKTPGVTSALMVVETKEEVWKLVESGMKEGRMREGMYDMDVVNREFAVREMVLPGRYCTLNSHWEAWDLPAWWTLSGKLEHVKHKLGTPLRDRRKKRGGGMSQTKREEENDESNDPEKEEEEEEEEKSEDQLEELWHAVEVLHFTAVGKPWDVEVVEAGQTSRHEFRRNRHRRRQSASDTSSAPDFEDPYTAKLPSSTSYLFTVNGDTKIDVHARLIDAFRIWHKEAARICKPFWTFADGDVKTPEEKEKEREEWEKKLEEMEKKKAEWEAKKAEEKKKEEGGAKDEESIQTKVEEGVKAGSSFN
ncbi:nucleotide-diphospho-sugar transferase [Ascodesmis nigricans]|uniref:Nucleotide-diphospho-sugar transferase n=1 Tax=Ascodesmis nigricans TaxID=341454 RepID=A0A4S2N823_9PEZI|nr:nucleotide-diphospho-sugar transferase [Ascodesmis nigricans]